METEKLKIFDEHRNPIGVATREEVHKMGYWHETFQCWFISRENEVDYILLQIRSDRKKDYPNLIDITAAGHLLANETVFDGIREIQEELGIDVSFNDLISLGIIDYCVTRGDLIDREIANVFLYESQYTFDDYILQSEEVSGIVKANFNDFYELWTGEKGEIKIQGYEIGKDGEKVIIDRVANKNEFVPHEYSYYITVVNRIKEKIQKRK
ncbi:NUDIX hydrolase [Heyndrickxia sp. NPDC080065]|uniref:NUDIX hydrolase n=1 Tax=Heyndrickxia sp. NPDC080065 TaxID=3390568 RepID=UPI003D0273A3